MKRGDLVMHIDEDFKAKVLKVGNGMLYLKTEDGFEVSYPERDFVVISEALDAITVPKTVFVEKNEAKKTNPLQKKKKGITPPFEVDLHIHKLINDERGMSAHDKLLLQIDTAERQLRFAIKKGIQRVVFIHGVGQGVLRKELEYLLNRQGNLKYYDANYQQYGVGALEVYLFQNSKE